MTQNKIDQLRKEIDSIDQKILQLLSSRGKKVIQIGKLKQKSKANFHVPERERKIFESLKKNNPGPFNDAAIETIFREVISASLALESPLKVAYFGPEATFTHMAAIKRFGLSAEFHPQASISEVFQTVFLNKANYGVVPIENSTAGIVSHTLDLFVEYPLNICGEVKLPIAHHLLSQKKDLKSIQTVYSHPHAFPQCRLWLEHHLPLAKLVDVASTARAAEMASEEENTAAISSEYAATRYGLEIVASHIEDHANNFTRFVVARRSQSTHSDRKDC